MLLNKDCLEFVALLNLHRVEFLIVDLDSVAVFFIGRTPLIRNKESTGRAKDLGDAEELRRREPKR